MNLIMKEVDRLFRQMFIEHEDLCQNPVTGGWFDKDLDSVATQKQIACRALLAREWLLQNGPPDAPPLPLHDYEIQAMKRGGNVRYMFGYYAQSVCGLDYKVEKHPSFDDYARGVMALESAPWFFKEDEELHKRFPPHPLSGLNPSTLSWKPPEERAKVGDPRYSSRAN